MLPAKRKTRSSGSVKDAARKKQAPDGPAEPKEAGSAYFQNAPPEFCNSADVEFHVGAERLPAHSQILASQSHYLAKMFQDLKINFSSASKFVLPEETLAGFTSAQLEQFLLSIYNGSFQSLRTATQAYDLYRLADLFDCPTMRAACNSYLGKNACRFLQATCMEDGMLKWFLAAEQFGITELRQACITFAAKNYGSIRSDPRLKQLPSSSLVEVMDRLFQRVPDPSHRTTVAMLPSSQLQIESDDTDSDYTDSDDTE
ncbi:hypothetical protein WJX74_010148 [Apatococcus lobatus]|uniref:BTB domain-containing protein n=1 Tax=Apatococcus lobatus TaxID=904363 RepID=A0AAW1RF27_9CHLO